MSKASGFGALVDELKSCLRKDKITLHDVARLREGSTTSRVKRGGSCEWVTSGVPRPSPEAHASVHYQAAEGQQISHCAPNCLPR